MKGLQASLLQGEQLQLSRCLRPLATTDTSGTEDPGTFPLLRPGLVTHTYTTGAALFIETAEETGYLLDEFPVNITCGNQEIDPEGNCGSSARATWGRSRSLCGLLQQGILCLGEI